MMTDEEFLKLTEDIKAGKVKVDFTDEDCCAAPLEMQEEEDNNKE